MIALRHSIDQIYGEAAFKRTAFPSECRAGSYRLANLLSWQSCPLLEKPVSSVEDCKRHHDLNHVGNRHIRLQYLDTRSLRKYYKDVAQRAVVRVASLKTCSLWIRHIQEDRGDLVNRARSRRV
jgi:hypothetical protein